MGTPSPHALQSPLDQKEVYLQDVWVVFHFLCGNTSLEGVCRWLRITLSEAWLRLS